MPAHPGNNYPRATGSPLPFYHPGILLRLIVHIVHCVNSNDILVGAKKVGSPTREDRQREVKRIVVAQICGDGLESDVLDEVTECDALAGNIRQAIAKVVA